MQSEDDFVDHCHEGDACTVTFSIAGSYKKRAAGRGAEKAESFQRTVR